MFCNVKLHIKNVRYYCNCEVMLLLHNIYWNMISIKATVANLELINPTIFTNKVDISRLQNITVNLIVKSKRDACRVIPFGKP